MANDEAKRWKNRLCDHYQAGSCCRDVKDCSFAHGDEDLQFYKTSLCPHHERGYCRNGPKCRDAHGKRDLRRDCKFHFEFKDGCNQGSACRFSHDEKDRNLSDASSRGRDHVGDGCTSRARAAAPASVQAPPAACVRDAPVPSQSRWIQGRPRIESVQSVEIEQMSSWQDTSSQADISAEVQTTPNVGIMRIYK